jgi:Ca2+-transporting ATPase
MVVTQTGMATAVGAIAKSLGETKEEMTPLQTQLSQLARILALAVFGLSLFIFLVGVLFGEEVVTMFTVAVAVAVSAIPEGMVVSLTVILAVGMQRILKKRAIVRKLVSAETLGSVTVLCVDKTGTLTEGVMRVVESELVDRNLAIRAAVIANNLDDPIEIALWDWARGQNHIDPQQVSESESRLAELPFDSTRKYMAVATRSGVWVKGAPEILLEKSRMTEKDRARWYARIGEFGSRGLRIIALAYKKDSPVHDRIDDITHLQFLGVAAVSDPIRPEVKESLAVCRKAGLSVKVITGDYRATSEAVMREIDMPITDAQREIMEGKELEGVSVDELVRRIRDIRLFCRVTPHQKMKIVQALKAVGEVVAMTGDGVNDALAMKKSDIAIVVENASDVAKETADLILLDSNLKTIVTAIEEGRGIFQNIRKVILYLLSNSLTEIIVIISSLLFRLPLPLTASQILWINILSDGFPNLALAFEPKDRDLMENLPRPKKAPILDREMKSLIVLISIVTSILAFAAFVGTLQLTGDLIRARTITFAIVGVNSLFYVFSCRSLSKPIVKSGIMSNRWLLMGVFVGFILQILPIQHLSFSKAFDTQPLSSIDWLIVMGTGLLLVLVIEIFKKHFISRRVVHSTARIHSL